jgi:transposase-like protein
VSALAEMYIQGVSTRKVKVITEELCGHTVSAATVSTIIARLDQDLERFARRAIAEILPEAVWQRCYVHFLRNPLDYLPRRGDDDCLQELRWIYDRRTLQEARQDLAAWLAKWQGKYPKLCDWVETNIEETLAFYRLPLTHHKHMKSTNMLERQSEEIKRRTRVVRIFPNGASCLRLIRASAIEMHENWIEAVRYINRDDLQPAGLEPPRGFPGRLLFPMGRCPTSTLEPVIQTVAGTRQRESEGVGLRWPGGGAAFQA